MRDMDRSRTLESPPIIPRALLFGLRHAFKTGDYSDLTVKCREQEWKVHRVIVCQQSEYFKEACKSKPNNAQDRHITLDDEEPEVVEAVIAYFYSADYDDDFHRTGFNPLVFNMKIHLAADEYCVEPLRQLAKEKFNRTFDIDDGQVLSWLGDAAVTAYKTEFDSFTEFRETIISIAVKHQDYLLEDDDWIAMIFRQLVQGLPDFMMDYARALAKLIPP